MAKTLTKAEIKALLSLTYDARDYRWEHDYENKCGNGINATKRQRNDVLSQREIDALLESYFLAVEIMPSWHIKLSSADFEDLPGRDLEGYLNFCTFITLNESVSRVRAFTRAEIETFFENGLYI